MIPHFKLSPGADRRLVGLPGVVKQRRTSAQRIVNRAQDLAPDHGPGITGRYNDSLKVIDREGESHAVADVSYAAEIEAKYHTLGRALSGGAG